MHSQGDDSSLTDHSALSFARRIEGCVIRNALDEERRARKALWLLKSRDRRIAYLERRVLELENAAEDLHTAVRVSTSLQETSVNRERGRNCHRNAEEAIANKSTLNRDRDNLWRSEDFLQNLEENEKYHWTTDGSDRGLVKSEKDHWKTKDSVFSESNQNGSGKEIWKEEDSTLESNLGYGAFENGASVPRLDLSKSSASNSEKEIFSTPIVTDFEDKIESNGVENSRDSDEEERDVRSPSNSKRNGENFRNCTVSGRNENWSERISKGRAIGTALSESTIQKFSRSSEILQSARSDSFLGASSRSLENGGTRQNSGIVVDFTGTNRAKETKERSIGLEEKSGETPLITGGNHVRNTKTTCTQTEHSTIDEKIFRIKAEDQNYPGSNENFEKDFGFWNVEGDPAPQWLIEAALRKAMESDDGKGESIVDRSRYEAVVSKLEEELSRAKEDLETALEMKTTLAEKYEGILKEVKENARKENEMLQEKIVRICTSVFERFGPYVDKRRIGCQSKIGRRFRRDERASGKLHKQLRATMAVSTKLRNELTSMRAELREKSERYESVNKSFLRLKQEMETTEINLNNLIAENTSLKRKIEETRDWMELKIGKDQQSKSKTQFRDTQKNRELINLRKKADEDLSTITQLRNKILRLESANTNKGFLLNSYKSQVADLNKQKEQLSTKINELENEISLTKNNNAQLRAKISILTKEKQKLNSESHIDAMKMEYEESIKRSKTRVNLLEKKNSEYLKTIKEVLRKFFENYKGRETGNRIEPGETEARDAACNILNMTADELTGFMEEITPDTMSSWQFQLDKITSKDNFSECLSRFLVKKIQKATRNV